MSVTLHLTCAFQVIKLPIERVIALFNYSFLQFLHIAESVNHQNFKYPFPGHFTNIDNFNLYSDRPSMGLQDNNKQKVRQAMTKI